MSLIKQKRFIRALTCVWFTIWYHRKIPEPRNPDINLIRLGNPRRVNDLFSYRWGVAELLISAGNDQQETLFELSSKDIILFKKHPEAISARNLIQCTVVSIFESGNRVGVELANGDGRLVAEVVNQAADELGIIVGSNLFAAIKASAFRRLG